MGAPSRAATDDVAFCLPGDAAMPGGIPFRVGVRRHCRADIAQDALRTPTPSGLRLAIEKALAVPPPQRSDALQQQLSEATAVQARAPSAAAAAAAGHACVMAVPASGVRRTAEAALGSARAARSEACASGCSHNACVSRGSACGRLRRTTSGCLLLSNLSVR